MLRHNSVFFWYIERSQQMDPMITNPSSRRKLSLWQAYMVTKHGIGSDNKWKPLHGTRTLTSVYDSEDYNL